MSRIRLVTIAAGFLLSSGAPVEAAPVERPLAAAATACQITVRPGQDVVEAVRAAGRGARVCFRSGEYRLTEPIVPDREQVLEGHGATLLGSVPLGPFARAGSDLWASQPQRAPGQRDGECRAGTHNACQLADAVFSDGQPLRRVMQRGELADGTFWYDAREERVYVVGNPAGHVLEMAVTPVAITAESAGASADVTIRGLTVEMFASPAQHGAIDATAPGWAILDDRVELNHGAGVTTAGDTQIEDVKALDNGQLGIGGTGDHSTVRRCLIAGNNWAEFDPGWEAGGQKFSLASDLSVRENTVRDNLGPGLWSDIDSTNVSYERNTVIDNERAGIFYEISSGGLIEGNTVRGNGFGMNTWLWGAGILLAASHDVVVRANKLTRNADGIGLIQQQRGKSERNGAPRVLHDIAIEENVEVLGGGSTGAVQDDGDRAIFSDPTITFSGNTYRAFAGSPFSWDDRELDAEEWRAVGHDVYGSFDESGERRLARRGSD